MKINKHFDNRTKTLKVGIEPEIFSEQELEEAKQDLIQAGASIEVLNEEIDETIFADASLEDCESCEETGSEEIVVDEVEAAEANRKLNKPFRTPNGPKKYSVYVKNDKGNVVKVNFGDPNMEIKRDNPARRRNFRARHNCDNPGPKWKARYWSCKFWSSTPVSELL